ncbi:unnamed protein product [Larinioides sclopetarius]|uniref:BTB domain-containing protein n=1 Tax=Larinioides sclopetarius TaxID=280406 RepID=A0AAV2AHW6_9ARAC
MSHEIYEEHYLDFYHPVKCIGDLGEKWCNFKWRIYNLQLNPKETFQSPVFTTRLLPKSHWYLEVKILSPGNLRTMEISLRRLQNYENAISIVDVIYKVICDEEIKISDKRIHVYNNEMPQSEKYCYSAPFYKSKTSYLTVECKLRPNKIMIKDVCHGNYDEILPVQLRKLLQTSELYDTIIKVGNQQFLAHYAILCARLPKLIPPGDPKEEGKHIIEINDLPVSVVKEMLKYAYTGQAYLDFEFALDYKDILAEHSNFFQRCCWEDNPFAMSFFNYETDSLSWKLQGYCVKSNLGYKKIELLRIFPSKLDFSLDILESQEEKKELTLTFKYGGEKMPKSTIISCTYYLFEEYSKETFELGETKILLHSNITQGKMKLCSLLEVKRGLSILNIRDDIMVLRTDFKICYGSSKSSIENLYEGQFDISQCRNCVLLRAEMHYLNHFVDFKDIELKGEDGSFSAHKAILIARWEEAEKYNVKENDRIVLEDYKFRDVFRLVHQLYTGMHPNKCET